MPLNDQLPTDSYIKTGGNPSLAQLQSDTISRWSGQQKIHWQVFFALALVIYGLTLLHFFQQRPTMRPQIAEYFKVLDFVSLLIALSITGFIYMTKKKYFGKLFLRQFIRAKIDDNQKPEAAQILLDILGILKKRLYWIWIAGVFLVIEGVLFYWVSFTPNNLHIYFIVGIFSLVLNYPRKDLVGDLPWKIKEILAELQNRTATQV